MRVPITAPAHLRQIVRAGPGLCQAASQLLQAGELLVVLVPEDDVTPALLGPAGVPTVRQNRL